MSVPASCSIRHPDAPNPAFARICRLRLPLALAGALVLSLAACGGGGQQGSGLGTTLRAPSGAASSSPLGNGAAQAGASQPAVDQALEDPVAYSSLPDAALAPEQAVEQAAVTHHSFTLGGRSAAYTATAGHLLLRAGPRDARAGQVEASMFYVAYTLDATPASTRPVTFFWNGGPGSSTIYLHLGGWGPRTLQIDEANLPMAVLAQAPDFSMDDNVDTLLGDTDMVFVDPVATGWSEAVAPWHNRDFRGVDADAASLRDFIVAYLRANGREMSPKYLYGESYGGIRTPIVARLLLSMGPLLPGGSALDGLILNSPILSYKSNCYMRWTRGGAPMAHVAGSQDFAATATADSCKGYIPSYLMVHWAQTHPDASIDEAAAAAQQAVQTVEDVWAPQLPAYLATLQTGKPAAPWRARDFPAAQQVAFQTLADASGLGSDDWARGFNMNVPDFASAVLGLPAARWDRDWSRVDRYNAMVRLPARLSGYVAPDGSPARWVSGSDYFNGSFLKAERDYMAGFLQYHATTPYVFSTSIGGWNWHHDGDLSSDPQSLSDLSELLGMRPDLRVLVMHGEQDLATPFYQTVLDLRKAGLSKAVSLRLFPGGHMLYLTRATRDACKTLLDGFYARALPQ